MFFYDKRIKRDVLKYVWKFDSSRSAKKNADENFRQLLKLILSFKKEKYAKLPAKF